MAKSRKSNRRTKRVYRRKPRINKKRRLTKRNAGATPPCSPETLKNCTDCALASTLVGATLLATRPKPPSRNLGFSRYEGRVDSPVAPYGQFMRRSNSEINALADKNPPERPGLRRRRL
tara:strand:+ start:629 stop:985 length:357 start_codon:yes stop_codon:yes gene_type:complete